MKQRDKIRASNLGKSHALAHELLEKRFDSKLANHISVNYDFEINSHLALKI